MKKKLLALLLATAISASAVMPASAIVCASIQRTQTKTGATVPDDVDGAIWYWDAAKYVLDYNLMDLVNGNFVGSVAMTREEIAESIYRDMNARKTVQMTLPTNLTDVQGTADYTAVSLSHRDAVAYCYAAGIMTGDTQGYLHPQDNVSRQELAAILMRYGLILEYGSMTEADKTAADAYRDTADIADWARGGVSYCKMTDLMKGDDLDNFNPRNSISRAEFAQILYNLDNKIYAIWSRLV